MNPPRGIGFLLHPGEQATVQAAVARAHACGFTAWTALDDPEAAMAEHGATTALMVTLGGDGTFLYGARLAAPRGIPVVGVNRGRLGFLNDVEIDALPEAISRFAAGAYTTQRRSMLETTVGGADDVVLAVNEIVVRARDVNVVRLRVDVDGDLLGAFDADGVVVATATGSTAYALSAGGPPVDPRVKAVVVVPLAAHAVISRPGSDPGVARCPRDHRARTRLRRRRWPFDRLARRRPTCAGSPRAPARSRAFRELPILPVAPASEVPLRNPP